MDYKEIFSKRLVELREAQNITQQELADKLQITRQSLSLYEKAERTINIELLARIADFFNVSTDYLMGKTEISTMNKDIQNACDTTGLSEQAVNKLNYMYTHAEEYTTNKFKTVTSHPLASTFFVFNVLPASDIISKFIESKHFEILIGDAQMYTMFIGDSNKENTSKKAAKDEKEHPIKQAYYNFVDSQMIAALKVQQASECVKEIFKEIYADSKEMKANGKHNSEKE